MKNLPLESMYKELCERGVFEKRPSELTASDLEFLASSLQISVTVSIAETDPAEKIIVLVGVWMIARVLLKWVDWQEYQTLDAANEALNSSMKN